MFIRRTQIETIISHKIRTKNWWRRIRELKLREIDLVIGWFHALWSESTKGDLATMPSRRLSTDPERESPSRRPDGETPFSCSPVPLLCYPFLERERALLERERDFFWGVSYFECDLLISPPFCFFRNPFLSFYFLFFVSPLFSPFFFFW